MTAFAYELASLLAAQDQARPGDPEGAYAMPWYLVIGEPGTGRSSAIRALSLSWPSGDGPVAMNVPQQQCAYWLPEKAVFIEPESTVMGPNRQHQALQELCWELKSKRPREPIDGMILVVSTRYLADANEEQVQRYANTLRRYLIEVMQALAAEVPVYIVATAVDDLWGFGDVFKWTAQRRDEEPWGFSLPPDLPSSQTPDRVRSELEGLSARMEAMCFDKLSGEDAVDVRARAFQHLAEGRDLVEKLADFMGVIAMANAFERAPWVRALVFGSGTPGTGQRLRHRVEQFTTMGYYPPQQSGTPQPGGMPIHAIVDGVLLPERDIVPTRIRWRDDVLLVLLMLLGVLGWIALVVVFVLRAVSI